MIGLATTAIEGGPSVTESRSNRSLVPSADADGMSGGGVTIGNDVQFGPGVKLASNHLIPPPGQTISAQPMEKKGIHIGDDVWIGANAVILDGVTIGNGCVIGANAVVNKDIPEYSVAVGVPAKVIRKR